VTYKASGPKGWAGIYWQTPPIIGEMSPAAPATICARDAPDLLGERGKGGERVNEFRVGGIIGKYPDSDVATLTHVRLTREWRPLHHRFVQQRPPAHHRGFGLFVNKAENSGGATIYLDDILFEGRKAGKGRRRNPVRSDRPDAGGDDGPGHGPGGRLRDGCRLGSRAPPPVVPPGGKDLEVKQIDAGLKVSFSSRLLFKAGQSVLEPVSGKVPRPADQPPERLPDQPRPDRRAPDKTGDKNTI